MVTRLAYRPRGQANLHPADAALNLPVERHSHGLRRLAAIESTRGSFQDATDAITRVSGAVVGKRQVEDLAAASGVVMEDVPSGVELRERPSVTYAATSSPRS